MYKYVVIIEGGCNGRRATIEAWSVIEAAQKAEDLVFAPARIVSVEELDYATRLGQQHDQDAAENHKYGLFQPR